MKRSYQVTLTSSSLTVLLLCTCALKQGQVNCCTDGFPSINQILSADNTILTLAIPSQGIHLSQRITCTGNITEFIYRSSSSGTNSAEFFNIWREITPNSGIFQIILPAVLRDTETLLQNVDAATSVYSLRVNLLVKENDIIGFTAFSSSTIRFLDLGAGGATAGIYRIISDDTNITFVDIGNEFIDTRFFPLITAVISPSSILVSSTSLPSSSSIMTSTQTVTRTVIPPGFVELTENTSTPTPGVIKLARKRNIIIAVACGVLVFIFLLHCTVLCVAYIISKKRNIKTVHNNNLSGNQDHTRNDEITYDVPVHHAFLRPKKWISVEDNSSLEINAAYVRYNENHQLEEIGQQLEHKAVQNTTENVHYSKLFAPHTDDGDGQNGTFKNSEQASPNLYFTNNIQDIPDQSLDYVYYSKPFGFRTDQSLMLRSNPAYNKEIYYDDDDEGQHLSNLTDAVAYEGSIQGTPQYSNIEQNMQGTPQYSNIEQNMQGTPQYSNIEQNMQGTPQYYL